jgi:hypothetical protein
LQIVVKKDFCNTAAALMMKIMELTESLQRDTMAKICRRSRKRTEAMMEAGSDLCLIS